MYLEALYQELETLDSQPVADALRNLWRMSSGERDRRLNKAEGSGTKGRNPELITRRPIAARRHRAGLRTVRAGGSAGARHIS